MPTIEELLELDLLTSREHTEQAGDSLNGDEHRIKLQHALKSSQICSVRRNHTLVAYAMLRRTTDVEWFVSAFNTHPLHRTSDVLRELFVKFAAVVRELGIFELKSNVYKSLVHVVS